MDSFQDTNSNRNMQSDAKDPPLQIQSENLPIVTTAIAHRRLEEVIAEQIGHFLKKYEIYLR